MSIKFSKHPDYNEKAPFYRLYRDLYEGKHNTLRRPEYLWPHELETDKNKDAIRLRAIRENRSRYLNLIEPIISRYTSLVFNQEPDVSEVEELFGDAISNVDGRGNSLQTWLKEDLFRAFSLYGMPIVVTDSYAHNFVNLEEQRQSKIKPIFQIINPLDAIDWQISTDPAIRGGLSWIRYEYSLIESRINASDPIIISRYCRVLSYEPSSQLYSVRVYKGLTKEETLVNDKTHHDDVINREKNRRDFEESGGWKLIEEKSADIQIPAMPVRVDFSQESWVREAAQQSLVLFNQTSARDSGLYYQGHIRTWVIGVDGKKAQQALSESTIAVLPAGASVTVDDPIDTTSIDRAIERTINNIFKVAFNQTRTIATDSKMIPGVESQQAGKEELTSFIKSEIETIETFANQCVQDFANWLGQENFTGKIKFNKDIQIQDVDMQIKLYSILKDEINKVPEWRKSTLKKFVEYQDLNEEQEVLGKLKTLENIQPAQVSNDPLNAIFGSGNGNKERSSSAN